MENTQPLTQCLYTFLSFNVSLPQTSNAHPLIKSSKDSLSTHTPTPPPHPLRGHALATDPDPARPRDGSGDEAVVGLGVDGAADVDEPGELGGDGVEARLDRAGDGGEDGSSNAAGSGRDDAAEQDEADAVEAAEEKYVRG
jgi:hypothetical protein